MTTKGAAISLGESGGMLPQKNLKSRSSEMRFPFWASKTVLFLQHLKISVVVIVVEFAFFINIIFIFINVIQTEGSKKSLTGGSSFQ